MAPQTISAPGALGPYSAAAISTLGKRTVYVSGQLGMKDGKLPESVEEQTNQALLNLENVLKMAGATFNDVLKCNVYLADIKDFPKVNEVYAKYFSVHKPARVCCQVGALPAAAKVEIDAFAEI